MYAFWKYSHSSPERFYHNSSHIEKVLENIERIGGATESTTFSAVFHDILKDVVESAYIGSIAASLAGHKQSFSSEVFANILSTKNHDPVNQQQEILCDADLAILGSSENEYLVYSENVRKEYAHINIKIFAETRSNILQMFLRRPRLYYTQYGVANWQSTAERNIKNEISKLNSLF